MRAALVSACLVGGVSKLSGFHGAVLEQEHFGLHPGWLWAALVVAVEVGGSLCVIFNRVVWPGAGVLAALTVVAMLVANDFWNFPGNARFVALNSFFEHPGLVAVFVMVTWLSGKARVSGALVPENRH